MLPGDKRVFASSWVTNQRHLGTMEHVLRSLEFAAVLGLAYNVGLAFVLIGAFYFDAHAHLRAVRTVERPNRTLTSIMNGIIILGVVVLLFSASAHAVDFLWSQSNPPEFLFSLSLVLGLAACAALTQTYRPPFRKKSKRKTSAFRSFMGAVAAGLSVACWLGFIAEKAVVKFRFLPLAEQYATVATVWIAVGFVVLIATAWQALQDRLDKPPEGRQKPVSDWEDFRKQARTAQDPARRRAPSQDTAYGSAARRPSGHHGASKHDEAPHDGGAFAARASALARAQENHRYGNTSTAIVPVSRAHQSRLKQQSAARAHQQGGQDLSSSIVSSVRALLLSGQRTSKKQNVPPPEAKTYTISEVKEKCKDAFIGAAVISLFTNLLMLTGPLFMLQVYDRVLTSQSMPTLVALFTLVVGLFAFMGVLDLIRSRLLVRIGVRIDRLISSQVFDRSVKVQSAAGNPQQAQLLKDLKQIRSFVSSPGMTSLFDMPWAPLYFLIIFFLHWLLGVLAIFGAAVLVVLSILNEFKSRGPVARAAQEANESDTLYETGRRNSEVLRAMGMMDAYRERWLKKHYAGLASNTHAADVSGLFSTLIKTIRLFLQSAVLAVGAYLVLKGELSPGAMIAASIIMSRGLAPIEQAVSHWRSFIAARQGLQRLSDEFDAPTEEPERLTLPAPMGRIAVENVFAAPLGQRDPVLKGLDFQMESGDALGVLGPSGSGKSTLARVLVGVWPTIRGAVRLDGAALDQWPPEQLGRNIGYLSQTVELFSGTIAENIARFNPGAQSEDVIAAARAANVHDLIFSLPNGYNTQVGEGGAGLSGGQRQRIALARALYGNPALIVLDEPNSNLDTQGEQALAQAIRTMREAGSTVIVMAHHRGILVHVNKVLVLKDGRQAAFGPKDDILRPKKLEVVKKKAIANGASQS